MITEATFAVSWLASSDGIPVSEMFGDANFKRDQVHGKLRAHFLAVLSLLIEETEREK